MSRLLVGREYVDDTEDVGLGVVLVGEEDFGLSVLEWLFVLSQQSTLHVADLAGFTWSFRFFYHPD